MTDMNLLDLVHSTYKRAADSLNDCITDGDDTVNNEVN